MPGRSGTGAIPNDMYKFSGKELDEELGLDWYYFGARYYDPAIGRWGSVDPKFHWYPSHSPYNYALNNPVKYTDSNGEFVGLGIIAVAAIVAILTVPDKANAPAPGDKIYHRMSNTEFAVRAIPVISTVVGIGTLGGLVKVLNDNTAQGQSPGDGVSVGKTSKYEDVTESSRGKKSIPNKQTNVTKSEFEGNLEKSGFKKSVSKDGKATSFTKDGKSYTTRKSKNRISTADFRKDATSKKTDLKIRLIDEEN